MYTMKHPEAYFVSQWDRNLQALTAHTDEPVVIIDMDISHTLVQYGELEAHTDKHLILRGSFNHPYSATVLDIPEHDTVIAGRDEVMAYAEGLLAQYAKTANHQCAIVAATIIDRFARQEEKPSVQQLCAEIAQAIIDAEPDDSMVAACVFDAPEALRSTVIAELHRRIQSHRTLHEIQRDRLLMLFVSHISDAEQITELAALEQIAQAKAASPLA